MTTVRFHPSEREVDVPAGTTLLEATRRAGLPIGSSCDGQGICGWCRLRVLEGAAELSPVETTERELLARIGGGPDERIACQARVLSPGVLVTASYWNPSR